MTETNRTVRVSVEEDGKKTVTEHNVPKDSSKVVIVINNQITFAPNTTQLASGGGDITVLQEAMPLLIHQIQSNNIV